MSKTSPASSLQTVGQQEDESTHTDKHRVYLAFLEYSKKHLVAVIRESQSTKQGLCWVDLTDTMQRGVLIGAFTVETTNISVVLCYRAQIKLLINIAL